MIKSLLLAIHLSFGLAGCPSGFQRHLGWCYAVVSERATWAEANIFCHAYQSQLVTVDSDNEQEFLKNYVDNVGGNWDDPRKFWLGGSDLFSEGHWEWAETRKQLTFTAWDDNNPDNGDDGEENCLIMDKDRHYRWNDDQCFKKYYFICERPMQAPHQVTLDLIG